MYLKYIILSLLIFIASSSPPSSVTFSGILRDFSNYDCNCNTANGDFNNFLCGVQKNLVEDTLGPENKPVPSRVYCYQSHDSFNLWWKTISGVNLEFPFTLTATWDEPSRSYIYDNQNFFPLDDMGFGNEGKGHNFGFTLEIHSVFTYTSGLKFDFRGDDDVWVFINKKLVVDLGGVHGASSGSIDLNTLNLVEGKDYSFDFFFCERHVTASSLKFSTSLQFHPCGSTDLDGDGIFDDCDKCPQGPLSLDIISDHQVSTDGNFIFTTTVGNTYKGKGYTLNFDFGDGTSNSVSTKDNSYTTTKKYLTPGNYVVTATISDAGDGCTSTSVTIQVVYENTPPPPPPTPLDCLSKVNLVAIIRDFANSNSGLPQAFPDFNADLYCEYGSDGAVHGMVKENLGSDLKPVLSDSFTCVTSRDTFSYWFRDVPGVNIPIPYSLEVVRNPSGVYEFTSEEFFPIDGSGYGNEMYDHNYGFTLELHTKFHYKKGQEFQFAGDDDVWIFVNKKLVVDIGGIHPIVSKTLLLDDLNLIDGKEYSLDLFFAERHIVESHLIFSTDICFHQTPFPKKCKPLDIAL